jgi:hypothetical protein
LLIVKLLGDREWEKVEVEVFRALSFE